MNLVRKSELARLAGKGKSAVSNAIKEGRLIQDENGRINLSAPKTIKFLNSPSEKGLPPAVSVSDDDPDIKDAVISAARSQEKKQLEDAELTRQKRIEKEMKNATMRGELMKTELVNQYLMTFLDRVRNKNKRDFSSMFDQIWEESQAEKREKVAVKRECVLLFDEWYYEAVNSLADEMKSIMKIQSK